MKNSAKKNKTTGPPRKLNPIALCTTPEGLVNLLCHSLREMCIRDRLKEYQTGSWVFIKCGGRLVDAQEDFKIVFNTIQTVA